MATRYFVVALLAWAVTATGQQNSNPPAVGEANLGPKAGKKYSSLGQTPTEFGKAFESGQVVLSHDEKHYLFVPKSHGGSEETSLRWSYGDKALDSFDPKDATTVTVQLGTKDDKPVYVPIWVSKDNAKSASENLKRLTDGFQWQGIAQVQSCARERECVKTCPDGKGGTYCCQWKCKFEK